MKAYGLSLLFLSLAATATEYDIPHYNAEVKLDGRLDESYWQQASSIDLSYENYPGEGITANISTKALVFYDDENLYIGFRASDQNPAEIRANLNDRDDINRDDSVAVVIDTFNDGRNAYKFSVNPLGVQFDARINDDNGWREDSSWDAIWYSAAKITENGWTAEMRIPLRALRFDGNKGQQTWKFAAIRQQPRSVNRQLANYREDNDMKCSLCLFDSIKGMNNVETGRHLQLTPTLTVSRDDIRNDFSSPWQDGASNSEAGLDVRWGISTDSVLNATINPDFSQVEADAAQLDVNTRYSLFVREKRPFFLDGASNFSTNGLLNLVHTRNIADPDYGVKLTGKSDGHTYGVLAANDTSTSFLLPGNSGSRLYNMKQESKVAVARYKVDVGERSNVGVLATARKGGDYSNTLASIDGTYSLDDKNSVQYQWTYSNSENPLELQDSHNLSAQQQDQAFSVDYFHDTRDYNLNFGYSQTGKDFRADMGFVGRADIKTWTVGGRRTYFGEKEDMFTRFGYFGNAYINKSESGDDVSEYYDFRGFANGPKQFFANFGYSGGNETYQGETFDFARFVSYSTITPLPDVELQLFVGYGKHIDWTNLRPGRRLDMQGTVKWQLGKHMNIFFDHTIESIKERDGYQLASDNGLVNINPGTVYTANQSDLRLTYQFDVKSQLQLTLQYTDIDRNEAMYQANYDNNPDNDVKSMNRFFSTRLLYSYEVNPQTLVYLGYSDGGLQTGDMSKLQRNQRSVFAKFSYAWQQ